MAGGDPKLQMSLCCTKDILAACASTACVQLDQVCIAPLLTVKSESTSSASGPVAAITDLIVIPDDDTPTVMSGAPKRRRVEFSDEKSYAQHVVRTFLPSMGPMPEGTLNEDVIEETDGYSDIVAQVEGDVDALHQEPCYLALTPHQRTAFIIIRWLCLPHSYEKTVLNDCLLSRLLLGNEARAHIDGIYVTSYGVWRRQTNFTLRHVRHMTTVMLLARSLLALLNHHKVGSGWDNLAGFFAGPFGRSELDKGDDFDLGMDDGDETSPWSTKHKTLMRYQTEFLGAKGKLDKLLSNIVNYFQVPRNHEPVVSCVDACVRLLWGQPFKQIPHSASNNCYNRMPARLTVHFSKDDQRRQDLFIATCFWNRQNIAPEESHHLDLCYSCLAMAGTGALMPAVAEALVGNGENGKTKWALSKVRLFGGEDGGCDFVDPRVLFDKTEFRINMGKFLNFLGLVFDEAGDTSGNSKFPKKLSASLMKLLIDRKKVIVRPPYAHDPSQHSWPRSAFFLLANTFPSIPEERARAWKAWYRRFLVLPLDSTYVSSLKEVDPDNGIFLGDADLENFITSGLYAAMYLKRKIQPHLISVTEKECIKTVRHPGAALHQFRKDVIGNAMLNGELCEEDAMLPGPAAPLTPRDAAERNRLAAQDSALKFARARILTLPGYAPQSTYSWGRQKTDCATSNYSLPLVSSQRRRP